MSLTREHFEQLTKSSPDIIVGTDRKGRVVYFNDGAHASLGYEEEEVLGQFVGLFYPSVKEARRVSEIMRGPEHGGCRAALRSSTWYSMTMSLRSLSSSLAMPAIESSSRMLEPRGPPGEVGLQLTGSPSENTTSRAISWTSSWPSRSARGSRQIDRASAHLPL